MTTPGEEFYERLHNTPHDIHIKHLIAIVALRPENTKINTMTTPLTQLIEEQKKELHNVLALGGGGSDVTMSVDVYNERVKETLHLLTTAITKGYELALEERERVLEIYPDILHMANGYMPDPRTRDKLRKKGKELLEFLTSQEHLKKTI